MAFGGRNTEHNPVVKLAILFTGLVLFSGCAGRDEAKFAGAWKVEGVQGALINVRIEPDGNFSCIHRSMMETAESTVLANLTGRFEIKRSETKFIFETANFDIQGGNPATLQARQSATDASKDPFLSKMNRQFQGQAEWVSESEFKLGSLAFTKTDLK